MEKDKINLKMNTAVSFFEKELFTVRTSRASVSILDNILVDAYGSKTPINQLGNLSTPDANTINIQVWDINLIKNIENSIIESNLGINPQSDGSLIRIPIPKLSEERRLELTKIVSQYCENAKISIRNIRREFIEEIKLLEKDKDISQDDMKKSSSEVQKITDEFVLKIDNIASNKKSEILKV